MQPLSYETNENSYFLFKSFCDRWILEMDKNRGKLDHEYGTMGVVYERCCFEKACPTCFFTSVRNGYIKR